MQTISIPCFIVWGGGGRLGKDWGGKTSGLLPNIRASVPYLLFPVGLKLFVEIVSNFSKRRFTRARVHGSGCPFEKRDDFAELIFGQ
jgi:hypothetical protein